MQWRLTRHPYGGWMIEYKNSFLGGWQKVNGARHYRSFLQLKAKKILYQHVQC